MVNIPINVSTFPTDEIGVVTDINQNINQEYYEWLLKQHNYFPDCAFHKEKFADTIKMEHSYTRDWKPTSNQNGMMPTRTILVERPPLCPSCHQLPPNHDEKVDTPEAYNIPIPPYNEEAGRRALNITEEMIKSCPNPNSDTDDWTESLQKFHWTEQQHNLFECVEHLLDMDQLGRLAISGLPNECLRRNAIIEKSVSRMRNALAAVHWEPRLVSWMHGLLISHLPTNYMASYIDILQTLKRKIPTLVDKMLYHKQIEMHKDLMSALMKRPWQPAMVAKTRMLPSNPVIVLVSSFVGGSGVNCPKNKTTREKRWMELLSTLTSVEVVTISAQAISSQKTIEQVTEQLVAMTRAKIQEIRNQTPNRPIILAGFSAGAALALQVALIEQVNSIVCLGFAFNTLNGVRGAPDDRIVELTTPVLFVIGQNAQRSSQEEMESLRERMAAQTLLVVVGSSDDALRVKRLNRSMEGVSQTMIDSMILDEIQEFATNCILNPPGPRKPKHLNSHRKAPKQRAAAPIENGLAAKRQRLHGKHQFRAINGKPKVPSNPNTKIILDRQQNGANRTNKSTAAISAAISAANDSDDSDDSMVQIDFAHDIPADQNGAIEKVGSANNIITITNGGSPSLRQKVKFIPTDHQGFVHIKPPPINMEKFYVKQQPNGAAIGDGGVGKLQSYTLGVKNIKSTAHHPVIHNKVITVKQKESNDQNVTAAAYKSDEETSELTSDTTDDTDATIEKINIFDIPILFADNDGNILDDQNDNDSCSDYATLTKLPPQNQSESSKMIEIISEEIITDTTIIDNDAIIEPQNAGKTNGLEIKPSLPPMPKLTPKPLTRSGNFVILNKNTLSQMKTVKHIPAGKLIFPSRDIKGDTNPVTVAATTNTTSTTTVSKRIHSVALNNSSSSASSSLASSPPLPAPTVPQQQPTPINSNEMRAISLDPSVRVPQFEGFKRLLPNQDQITTISSNITISTNGRPKSPKSGILIKRNHLKNCTVRKLNVVRLTKADDDKANTTITTTTTTTNNNNDNHNEMIKQPVPIAVNNNSNNNNKNSQENKHRSLNALIDQLEN